MKGRHRSEALLAQYAAAPVVPVAIVQARMPSTRLPGKSLADIHGQPALALLVGRLGRAETLDGIVVATSTDVEDDPVDEVARGLGCEVHRGPRDDVLTRYVEAAAGRPGPFVRITADCPLTDPGVVDQVVRLYGRSADVVYASNIEPRSFPVGLDTEVVSRAALLRAGDEARDPDDREHVTLLIRRSPGRYPRVNLTREPDLSHLRWTVDHPQDLEFVRRLVERLGGRRYEAGLEEILVAVRAEPSLADFHGRRG
jgi:spore coat polysaccharide biosynthesis protein SpsF (cytidylyltransferase family)